jgi:putative ABC transport system permease protein
MKLAWKELLHNRKKYLLISIIVLLMMFMVLSLSGLVNGLGRAVSSGVENMKADSFIISDDAEKLITVSSLTENQYKDATKGIQGKTTPLEILRTYIQTKGSDEKKDAVYFGIDPDVILADEPTASLDSKCGRKAVEMIAMEVHKRKKAAIMVTHDQRVLDLADTVYQMEDGKLRKLERDS